MTIQEAQDLAAKEWNEAFDYTAVFNGASVGNIKMIHLRHIDKRAMEIYGKAKWEEACAAQMEEVYAHILPGQNTNAHAINHWTKTPEFKP